jgi:hypothetical protein
VPNINLVSNLGFNAQGTHTLVNDKRFSKRKVFKYRIPDITAIKIADKDADDYTYRNVFNSPETGVKKKGSINFLLFRMLVKFIKVTKNGS